MKIIDVIDEYKDDIKKMLCNKLDSLKSKDICNDNLIGIIKYDDNDQWKLDKNYISKKDRLANENKDKILIDNILENKSNNKRIIIILESPHKDEYIIKENKCIGYPAMGQTGISIKKYLQNIINNKLIDELDSQYEYDIILMNSIQYQTSLGENPKLFRDRIWTTLWIKYELRSNFIERLKEYKPDIIFNFCSKGDHSKDLISNLTGEGISIIGKKFINSLNIDGLNIDNKSLKYKDKCLAESEGKNKGFTLRSFVSNAIDEYLEENSLTDDFS